jgi:hypothetical protein
MKVKLINKEFNYFSTLRILPALLKIDQEMIFLVVVYRPPGPIGNFINTLLANLNKLIMENPIQSTKSTGC